MRLPTRYALFLIASTLLSTAVVSQQVYKCGDNYSQIPCPGGALIDTSDARTAAQKKQTDAATVRNTKTAQAMTQARLQQEKADLAANTPRAKASAPHAAPKKVKSTVGKKKTIEPENFTARVPGEKNKATAP